MHQTRAIIISLIVIGVGSRLIPHYPNFTGVGAVALFAAAFAGKRSVAIAVPYLVMLFSDMVLNNLIYSRAFPEYYQGFIFLYKGALWSYAAFGLIVMFGFALFRKGFDLPRLIIGALGASLIFFLLSNFGYWASIKTLYPPTLSGLLACYTAGLPFLLNQIAGDLFYSLTLYALATYVFTLKPKKHLA